MKIYTNYLWYVLRHKWFVMLACFRGRLFWRGITHDMSKLRPSEFFPYARHFNGNISKGRDSTGAYDPTRTGNPEFEHAWLLHQRRNDHHWQFWVEPRGYYAGVLHNLQPPKTHKMSNAAMTEMICDWVGAGRAQGNPDTLAWYAKNGKDMILNEGTRMEIDRGMAGSLIKELGDSE